MVRKSKPRRKATKLDSATLRWIADYIAKDQEWAPHIDPGTISALSKWLRELAKGVSND
jgi:hypothetical protein